MGRLLLEKKNTFNAVTVALMLIFLKQYYVRVRMFVLSSENSVKHAK